jgi:hypothetical protein
MMLPEGQSCGPQDQNKDNSPTPLVTSIACPFHRYEVLAASGMLKSASAARHASCTAMLPAQPDVKLHQRQSCNHLPKHPWVVNTCAASQE